ncbi:DUF397 domain-containing protein [Streptomyces sp. NPDC054841]
MSDLTWFKSSYSGGGGQDCIEVAAEPTTIHVRDSKDVTRPVLDFTRDQWAVFVEYASA